MVNKADHSQSLRSLSVLALSMRKNRCRSWTWFARLDWSKSPYRLKMFLASGVFLCLGVWLNVSAADVASKNTESDFYRIVTIKTSQASDSRSKNWKPAPDSLVLEVSGLAILPDGRLAVAIRKGEVWLLSNVYDDPPSNVVYHQFASSLHEPLGLLFHQGSLVTMQRTEMTRLLDKDNDDVCDVYETMATGWGVTGNYHEYAFGPEADGHGNLWLTLNIGMGLKGDQKSAAITNRKLGFSQALWRGWGMIVTPDGQLKPMCAGMRSPSGLGANLKGDVFYSDQQGNWVATNSLHHLRKGAFYHHPESLASVDQPASTIESVQEIPNGLPIPDAIKQFSILKPPAVWLPYKKAGQSATDIMVDASNGKFGPFAGQLFVGEFTQSSINRVYLETIDGEYQGACFPFREGFASAVLRLEQGADGSVFTGLSNRGWSSLGPASYGLQRLAWTGRIPMEMKEIRAQPDGFEIVFTKPLNKVMASQVSSYRLSSHTYRYHSQYGSDDILEKELDVTQATVSDDGLRVRLVVSPLREFFVHTLNAFGVQSIDGEPLLHPEGYYTLNRIPVQIR
jgi:glucose/arabinose dehydrogenase